MQATYRKRGPIPKFTDEDDCKLVSLVHSFPPNSWKEIAKQFQDKTAKQCRDRWNNYANPQLKHGDWDPAEDSLIIQKVNELGSAWSTISAHFINRSPNDVRYRWVQLTKGDKEKSIDQAYDYVPSSAERSPKEAPKEELKKTEPSSTLDNMFFTQFFDVENFDQSILLGASNWF